MDAAGSRRREIAGDPVARCKTTVLCMDSDKPGELPGSVSDPGLWNRPIAETVRSTASFQVVIGCDEGRARMRDDRLAVFQRSPLALGNGRV